MIMIKIYSYLDYTLLKKNLFFFLMKFRKRIEELLCSYILDNEKYFVYDYFLVFIMIDIYYYFHFVKNLSNKLHLGNYIKLSYNL